MDWSRFRRRAAEALQAADPEVRVDRAAEALQVVDLEVRVDRRSPEAVQAADPEVRAEQAAEAGRPSAGSLEEVLAAVSPTG